MPKVTYLLVQDQTPAEYKIHDVETSKDIPNTSEIQLLNPIADFRGRSLGDIKRELREINPDFLENKVAKYSANDEMSFLQADDRQGKVLILFRMQPDARSTLERVKRETQEVIAWYEKDPRRWFRPEHINKAERMKEGFLY